MKLHQTYWSPFPTRVRLLIYAKGLDIEIVDAGEPSASRLAKGGFQGVGSVGRIPALELDDGRILAESEVICEYLEDTFPERTLRPKDPWQLAQVRLMSRLSDFYVVMALVPLFMVAGEPKETWDRASILASGTQLREALQLVEDHIGSEGYAVGRSLTQADGALIPILMLASGWAPRTFDFPNPLAELPKLTAYMRDIARDPIAARLIEETREAFIARRKSANA